MDNSYFVTITGINHYYGKKPFEIGRVIKLIKEPDNEYDSEAIFAFLPFIDKIGYVANSTYTVYDGTISAGRLYDKIENYTYGKVMFVTRSSAIVLVLDKDDVEEIEDTGDESLPAPSKVIDAENKSTSTKKLKKPIGFKG